MISGIIGVLVVGSVFLIFYAGDRDNIPLAQTLAVTTSVLYQMLRSLGCGRLGAFDLRINRWLVGAVALSVILHF